jgi:RNA polymerase sigma-70 factor (ECF subfamily)
MMVVTKNLCLDKIRAGGHQKVGVDERNIRVSFASPDKMLELKDEVSGVHQIIGQLPLMQQMIVQMRDVEGLDFEEMEEILNINANAIRVNLSRARKAIRDQLTKKHDYEYQGNKNIG